jgi:hypothetical protein
MRDAEYGSSWKRRGGIGAFMMLARKFDRIEVQAKKHNYDLFAAITADRRPEGIINDIQDLRHYLFLVEAEMQSRGIDLLEPPHRRQRKLTEMENPFGFSKDEDMVDDNAPANLTVPPGH